MHPQTLKEAKSTAGSTDGGFLYSTTVRTVGEEKTQKPDDTERNWPLATLMVVSERFGGQFLDENKSRVTGH